MKRTMLSRMAAKSSPVVTSGGGVSDSRTDSPRATVVDVDGSVATVVEVRSGAVVALASGWSVASSDPPPPHPTRAAAPTAAQSADAALLLPSGIGADVTP